MSKRREIVDSRGRVWAIAKVAWKEAEEEDFRFWYEGLTPEQRVEAVGEALEGCLKTRGIDAIPRLRRIHRRIKCPWGSLSRDRRARGRFPRSSARHQRP
ncbi:MAG: hypothetical protein Q8Q12_08265 [bacterium]|nr:hypothetical protein [bacterium]